jgi:hypothetical protein
MAGFRLPGPIGIESDVYEVYGLDVHVIDEGTRARTDTPPPGSVGVTKKSPPPAPKAAAPLTDPEIERLDLAPTARAGAYALKKAHPTVRFTSGRRDKAEQASAMASNIVKKRNFIVKTYKASPLATRCQDWVDRHPEKTTREEIAAGLLAILDDATDGELASLSKHLSGQAFDVQPVQQNAKAIKKTIRQLRGVGEFLDHEAGLVRWHVPFVRQ